MAGVRSEEARGAAVRRAFESPRTYRHRRELSRRSATHSALLQQARPWVAVGTSVGEAELGAAGQQASHTCTYLSGRRYERARPG